jgi:hypothetical protein
MRKILACLLFAAVPAWAQAPAQAPKVAPGAPDNAIKPQAACATCGVVRSIRVIKKEMESQTQSETGPSGLVASVPLGGGKPQVGSSTKVGTDKLTVTQSWEIGVLMDNGSLRLLRAIEEPEVREGDKVRINEKGQVKLRTD